MCWYCQKYVRVDELGYKLVPLSRDQGLYEFNATAVRVPRCFSCRFRHRVTSWIGWAMIAVGFIIACILGSAAYAAARSTWAALAVFAATIGVFNLTAWLLTRAFVLRGVRDDSAGKGHPQVQALVSQGWRVGLPSRWRLNESDN